MGEIFSPGDEKNNYLEFDTDKTISVSTMSWNPGGNGAAAASLPLFKVLWYGDLAFEGNRTKGHPYGKLVINDIGAGIMSSRFRTLTARQAPCVSFWKFFLLNDAAFRPIYINCTKRGTLMTELVVPELLRSNVVLPSEAEQSLIGAYFRQLEHLITLHQRKCQYRGLYGYLSWEQRKLGELCTISKGHGYSKADIRDVGTPLILYGRLYTQYESRIENVDTFAVEQEGSLLSKGNEVIVPASGETAEDIAVASSVRRSGIIFGGDLNVVTPVSKLDPDYIALAITYSKAHDDLAKRAQGKSVVHVHGNDIAEVEIPYPSESEQKRISTVVLGLDSLITLHQ